MSFAPTKKQKTDGTAAVDSGASNGLQWKEGDAFFPNIDKIEYKGPDCLEPLAFKYYNPEEKVMGKTMKEWCRFSVCFWHTFRGKGSDPFGHSSMTRPWDDETETLDNAFRRARAAFEFMSKLGVEFYTFHDTDVAPAGSTLDETNANLDKVVDLMEKLQGETGIKLLWATQNLFSNPRYMNGGATNPEVHTFACAAAQAKKVIEVNKRLGGGNLVFWGGREGYQTILNTDVKREIDHLAAFLKMCVAYKKKIGDTSQCLIEPKPREPTKHQYDYDAQTVIGFLKSHNLDGDFKLNIGMFSTACTRKVIVGVLDPGFLEGGSTGTLGMRHLDPDGVPSHKYHQWNVLAEPDRFIRTDFWDEPNHTTLAGHDYEHDLLMASKLGFLGSVDANTGDQALGWDTDQFPMDVKKATLAMKIVIEQGGLAPGGLNFDCKLRRESTDIADMFIAHIGAMDTFARGLRNAARMLSDGELPRMVAARYASFGGTSLGKRIEEGKATLEECEEYAKTHGEPELKSGQQELYEMVFNRYV